MSSEQIVTAEQLNNEEKNKKELAFYKPFNHLRYCGKNSIPKTTTFKKTKDYCSIVKVMTSNLISTEKSIMLKSLLCLLPWSSKNKRIFFFIKKTYQKTASSAEKIALTKDDRILLTLAYVNHIFSVFSSFLVPQ